MTTSYQEVEGAVEVPKNVGIEGFLRTISEILKRPRVHNISIDSKGNVSYKYYLKNGEKVTKPSVDFGDLEPYYIIRNAEVGELTVPWGENAATVIGMLFDAVDRDQLLPIAFVSGANSSFWEWHHATTGIRPHSRENVYGLPFLTDRHCDDSTLILCAGYARGAPLIDTKKSYRVVMDVAIPKTQVSIL